MRFKSVSLGIGLGLALYSGGATASQERPMVPDALSNHIINVGYRGTPETHGEFANTGEEIAAKAEAFYRYTEGWKRRRLLLIAHGGLVPQAMALSAFKDLAPRLRKLQVYPLLVLWNSDTKSIDAFRALDAYYRAKATQDGTLPSQRPLASLPQFEITSTGQRGITGVVPAPPMGLEIQHAIPLPIGEEKGYQPDLNCAGPGIVFRQVDGLGEVPTKAHPAPPPTCNPDPPIRLPDWFIEQRSVEEGGGYWADMKGLARSATNAPKADSPLELYFDRWLRREGHLRDKNTEIHLVGHSAGSVLIGHLTDLLVHHQRPVDSISLLAPACTNDFFHEHMGHAFSRGEVRKLSMFTMSEGWELADSVEISRRPSYHKSLLWLISHGFESPEWSLAGERILGLRHFLEQDPKYKGLREMPGFFEAFTPTAFRPSWVGTRYCALANSHSNFMVEGYSTREPEPGTVDLRYSTLRAVLCQILDAPRIKLDVYGDFERVDND